MSSAVNVDALICVFFFSAVQQVEKFWLVSGMKMHRGAQQSRSCIIPDRTRFLRSLSPFFVNRVTYLEEKTTQVFALKIALFCMQPTR